MKAISLFDADAWVDRGFKPAPRPQTPIVHLPKPKKPEPRSEKVDRKPKPFTPVFKAPDGEKRVCSPSIRKIVVTVSRISQVPVKDILGKDRKARATEPRQIVCWIARRFTEKSLPGIATSLFRDHTTILSNIRRIDEMIEENGVKPSEDTAEAWTEVLLREFRAKHERWKLADAARRLSYGREYSAARRADGLVRRGGQWVSPKKAEVKE